MRRPEPGEPIYDRGQHIGTIAGVVDKSDFAPDAWRVTLQSGCRCEQTVTVVDRGQWRRI